MSLVDEDGEWKFRKINIFGVLKSFISQLKPGQDLTRVSLPAVLLHPYSLLEVMGSRELTTFDVLVELNRQKDPLERFLNVLRWLFSCIQQETFHKKPFNPVLGETHVCTIESEEYGRTEFTGEQVSHHPPVSAFCVRNRQEEVTLTSNISFSVKFATNSVSVVTEGAALIRAEQLDEEYEMSKCLPDMKIARIVWGVKKIFWTGEITISCAKTGYSATVIFEEKHDENIVKGFISHFNGFAEETLYHLEGKCSRAVYLVPTDRPSSQKKLLIDVAAVQRPRIVYPPRSEQPPLSSMNVWADVARYIVDDDMSKADEAKKTVENAQRERIAERKSAGIEYQPTHFVRSDAIGWAFKAPKDDKKTSSAGKRSSVSATAKPDDPKKQPVTPVRRATPNSTSSSGSASRRRLHVSSSDESDSDSDLDSSDTELADRPSTDKSSKMRDAGAMPASPSMSSLRESLKREDKKDQPAAVSDPRGSGESRSSRESRSAARDDKRTADEREDERKSTELLNGAHRDPAHRLVASAQLPAGSTLQAPVLPSLQHSASSDGKEEPRDKRSRRTHSASSPMTIGVPLASSSKSSRGEYPPPMSLSTSPTHVSGMPNMPTNYVREEMLDKDERKRLRAEAKKALGSKLGDQVIDDNVNIKAGWMKMRNSMKLWVNKYFVLRPGKLIYYDNYKKKYMMDRCAGILRLSDCKLKIRQSVKDGYAFKIYHLLHYPIYHRKGLQGETLKLAMIPVSWNYCLLKCSSEEDRTQWMNSLNQQIAYANYTESPTRRLQLPIANSVPGAAALMSSASESEGDDDEPEEHKEDDLSDTRDKVPKVAGLQELDLKSEEEDDDNGHPRMPRVKGPPGAELAEDLFQKDPQDPEVQGEPGPENEKLFKELAEEQRAVTKSFHKKTVKALDDTRRVLEARLLATERKLLALTSRTASPPASKAAGGIHMAYWKFALILFAVFFFARWIYNVPVTP